MNLKIKPFTKTQLSKIKTIHSFIERGIVVNILHKKGKRTDNMSDGYTFGYKSVDGKYFWFFNGKITTTDRKKALEAFSQLILYCDSNNLGLPFIFKKKKYYK